jgi:Bifunctional DNA primase/polymerase, N-terminal/Family of unknown function (DUF5906)/Primase C terminal 2 (PriCT-2)
MNKMECATPSDDRWDPENNQLHKAALIYQKKRWPIAPIWWMKSDRCACGKPHCNSPAKHPIAALVPRGIKDATLDQQTAIKWWTRFPQANIAISLGKISGLIAVDVDGPSGRELLEGLLTKYDFVLDPKFFVETGRVDGGRHYFFTYPANVRVPTKKVEGLEVRSDGAYVVAPPSRHHTGKPYTWQNISLGSRMDELPQCFIDFAVLGEKVFAPGVFRKNRRTTNGARPRIASSIANIHSPPAWSEAEEARIAAALEVIPADDRDIWLRCGMGLHWTTWGERAWQIWRAWSQKSAKFNLDEQIKAWESFGRPDYGGPVATLGTIFHLGQQHGYEPTEEPLSEAEEPAQLKNIVDEINEKHFLIRNIGGKCMVGEMVPDPASSGQMLSLQGADAFRTWRSNQYVIVRDNDGNAKRRAVASYWLQHPRRRGYEGVDLVPNAPEELPSGKLNLWRGFGVKAKQGKWQLMRDHICYVLADGDPQAAEYILRWTAWAFQHPGEPAEVALVQRGGKGSGKGVFGNSVARCFGEHALHIFNQNHLTGKFNGHLRSCLFLFCDEAYWAGDKKGESVLKGLITERSLVIEQKGIDPIQWPNRLHVLMAANAEWVVPASCDERRFAVFDVSPRYAQGAAPNEEREAYFNALHAERENGGVEAMLYDLLHRDLGKWHPRQVYQTEGLRRQKERSLSPLNQWFVDLLQEGKLPWYSNGGRDSTTTRLLVDDAKKRVPRLRDLSDQVLADFLKDRGCTRYRDSQVRGWKFRPLGNSAQNGLDGMEGGIGRTLTC